MRREPASLLRRRRLSRRGLGRRRRRSLRHVVLLVAVDVEVRLDAAAQHRIFDLLARLLLESARRLLTDLHAKEISTTDDANIETRQDNLYRAGIQMASVKQFNKFKSKYNAFNKAR